MKILIWIDKQSLPFFTISQGFINLCVYVYVKELRHPHEALVPAPPAAARWDRRVDGSIS